MHILAATMNELKLLIQQAIRNTKELMQTIAVLGEQMPSKREEVEKSYRELIEKSEMLQTMIESLDTFHRNNEATIHHLKKINMFLEEEHARLKMKYLVL
ncbi:tail -length tape-measure-like protein [Glossina pallidipes salivary gland hypertrophy virus]|uniref:Tail-length tape-measure-like protein n=1 Tax=Glossina hytrovirus (isolate Glossina pallidipes/Ethiopia/Seibersdorf/-) TaxID=379529 RepID=A0A0Y0GG10_GHVS|nr:tail -length tape-measure-like protein [Glossina pallidipes salivary gland hypertrophy virus]